MGHCQVDTWSITVAVAREEEKLMVVVDLLTLEGP